MERQKHPSKFQSKTDASPGHFNLPLCMRVLDLDSRAGEEDRSYGESEMRCYRKLLGITYLDRITNDNVRRMIKEAIGPYDELLSIVKKRKLRWYGHVMRSTGLSKTILQGTEKKMGRRHHQMYRAGTRRNHETDQGPTSMDPAVRDVYCRAPTIV